MFPKSDGKVKKLDGTEWTLRYDFICSIYNKLPEESEGLSVEKYAENIL